MFEIQIQNNEMIFRGVALNYDIHLIDDDGVYVRLYNEVNDFITYLIANEVSINGVIQTSVQMIIDTLSNGQS